MLIIKNMRDYTLTEKNMHIMKLVTDMIWLIVCVIILFGVIFPAFFILLQKNVYLKEQNIAVSFSEVFMSDFIHDHEAIVSCLTDMDPVKSFFIAEKKRPEVDKSMQNFASVEEIFHTILTKYPSFQSIGLIPPDMSRSLFIRDTDEYSESKEAGHLPSEIQNEIAKIIQDFSPENENASSRIYNSKVYPSWPDDTPVFSLFSILTDPAKNLEGIVYTTVRLDALREYISAFVFNETGRIYLVDSYGNLIVHPSQPITQNVTLPDGSVVKTLHNVADDPVVTDALNIGNGHGIYHQSETGKMVIASYRRLDTPGWTIIVEQDVTEIFSSIRIYIYILVLVIILVTVLAFMIVCRVSGETAEANRKQDELIVISETDPLTGLLNRRSMLSRMTRQFLEYEEHGQPFCIVLFDIDNFKQVNDTFGHIFGDIVLREIAARTVSCLRVNDILFRWGGEEFLAVIKNCDTVKGRGVAEKIRRVVCDAPISNGIVSVQITVSIGLTEYHGESVENLIIHADEALYRGKRNGKNVVVVYEDPINES